MIELSEIIYKWSRGEKIKSIVRSMAVSRNTVRSVIKKANKYGLVRRAWCKS